MYIVKKNPSFYALLCVLINKPNPSNGWHNGKSGLRSPSHKILSASATRVYSHLKDAMERKTHTSRHAEEKR